MNGWKVTQRKSDGSKTFSKKGKTIFLYKDKKGTWNFINEKMNWKVFKTKSKALAYAKAYRGKH